ncbi:TPA: RHS repeat-associated core domain-containing protein [Streptococcus suis]
MNTNTDDNNRLTKLENKDGITTYTYDKNGNRTASKKNDEKLDYIYDTENRLLAVKDKEGLLMAALYDGDDNRVFTASRKEGKNTYQLFQRKPKDISRSGGKKSPYTAPAGEENSIFWYGFSQNVLQSLSTLPQTVGTIWHEIFDDVSTAYHQKVAKDRATKEGLVVNPPDLDNLPGEGEVTYASQVQDVLIPYTTREDTYHYYEERNYVNDINREYTEVLQTYDHDLKARETYTYGNGRASYLDNQEDTNYTYLTNQSGSVTGLTQDGEVVASSTYHLYGSMKETTDTTGNPYAYNGEARDVTGLDYLRARYYDSQAGTFLTEDSYPGELTTPLTQNGYAYVSNNPVNYTDPSGHFFKKLLKGAGKLLTKAKNAVVNFAKNTARAVVNVAKKAYNIGRNIVNTVVNTAKGVVNWAGTQINNAKNWAVQQWNNYHSAPSYQASSGSYSGGYHSPSSSHAYAQQQQAQARAQAEQRRQQHIRDEYSQSTGIKTTPKTREAKSLFRNWGKALKEMYTHVCKTAKRVKKQVANYVKKIDWKKVAVTAGAIGVGIALTVATGGLGAPIAMAIGGAASGAILSGYDAYSSGQRGWGLAGSTLKGAGLGAITGFVGGQFIGAGANVAANVTQNIANQTVRHVVSAGVEAGVETAIDTGISVATGNPISLKNVATDYGLNLITNGSGSVSSKKSAKADIPTNKPKSGDVAVTKSRQSSTPVQQMSNPGPNPNNLGKETLSQDQQVYGPYYDEAKRRFESNPDWYADPDTAKFVSSEDVALKRKEYNDLVSRKELPRGHHRQALAFGGENVPENIQFTGESTIKREKFGDMDMSFYHEQGYGKADAKVLKIHQTESGLYVFGNNPQHTEVTNFQNQVLNWQRKSGLR